MSSRKNQKGQASRPSQKKKQGKQSRNSQTVSAPVAFGRIMKSPGATVSRSDKSGNSVRISHREYVMELSGSTAYACNTISINPGLPGTFPWLAGGVALGYESYTFEKLEFLYEPSCSSSTAGKVIMAIDFDATDVFPSSKSAISNYEGAVSVQPWMECCYSASHENLTKMAKQRYIRQGTIATALNDLKTFDVGNLHIATQGMSGGTIVGEIWAEYTVVLQTPQTGINSLVVASTARLDAEGTISRTAPFGTGALVTGGIPVTATGSTITFGTAGQWLVDVLVTGTTVVASNPTAGGTAARSVLTDFYVNAGSNIGTSTYAVNVTTPGQTLSLDYTPSAATVSDSVTRIAPYPFTLG